MPATCPWTARVWGEYRQSNLTRSHRDVLLTLKTFRGQGGIVCPSHETLADRADCGVRTVQRALRQAEHLGLVSWVERRVKAAWRWLRTSNRYFLRLPETPIAAGMRIYDRAKSTNGQGGAGGECKFKKEALRELLAKAARLPDLLAMRREALKTMLGKVSKV
jgi:hypothetical protein